MLFDHFFIATHSPHMLAERLIAHGLTEGTPNIHPGQGTANRRFFFHNVFLEVLYIHDQVELIASMAAPLQLAQRFAELESDASPFGICFRPEKTEKCSFESFVYKPNYLPEPLQIDVAPVILSEPLFFFLDFAVAPQCLSGSRKQVLQQPEQFLERVTLTLPQEHYSRTLSQLHTREDFSVIKDSEHLLCLDFGGQKTIDLRPDFPLMLKLKDG